MANKKNNEKIKKKTSSVYPDFGKNVKKRSAFCTFDLFALKPFPHKTAAKRVKFNKKFPYFRWPKSLASSQPA